MSLVFNDKYYIPFNKSQIADLPLDRMKPYEISLYSIEKNFIINGKIVKKVELYPIIEFQDEDKEKIEKLNYSKNYVPFKKGYLELNNECYCFQRNKINLIILMLNNEIKINDMDKLLFYIINNCHNKKNYISITIIICTLDFCEFRPFFLLHDKPYHFYDDYVKLLRDVEVDHTIKVGTPIVFTGKAGKVDYQSKITTYGKIRISKILERDMDDLGFTKDMYTRMDAKAATKLSAYLCDFPEDGIEKRRELQKFCLRVVSLAGVVTFSFDTLFTDTNTETYQKLRKIVDSPDLTDQQKTALITPLYDQYQKEVEATFSDDLKNELNRAGRVKISSISSMNMPQLIISGVDEQPIITHGSLLSGMTEDEYRFHAIENRSLQSIKQSGV